MRAAVNTTRVQIRAVTEARHGVRAGMLAGRLLGQRTHRQLVIGLIRVSVCLSLRETPLRRARDSDRRSPPPTAA